MTQRQVSGGGAGLSTWGNGCSWALIHSCLFTQAESFHSNLGRHPPHPLHLVFLTAARAGGLGGGGRIFPSQIFIGASLCPVPVLSVWGCSKEHSIQFPAACFLVESK